MPARRAMQICPTPACPTLTSSGRCQRCQAKASQARSTTKNAGRGASWQRTRAAYLRAHPYCECDECAALPAVLRPRATEVDHIDGLGPLGPRGHDWTNLASMTKSHHSRKTARNEPGGWNDRDE